MSGPSQRVTSRNMRTHMAVWAVIIFVSVVGPSYFLTKRAGNFLTGNDNPISFSASVHLGLEDGSPLAVEPSFWGTCNPKFMLQCFRRSNELVAGWLI